MHRRVTNTDTELITITVPNSQGYIDECSAEYGCCIYSQLFVPTALNNRFWPAPDLQVKLSGFHQLLNIRCRPWRTFGGVWCGRQYFLHWFLLKFAANWRFRPMLLKTRNLPEAVFLPTSHFLCMSGTTMSCKLIQALDVVTSGECPPNQKRYLLL